MFPYAAGGGDRAITWTYDTAGRLQYVTTHSDNIPDTGSWTDVVTQIKNTYDAAGYLTKQEQEEDGKVDGNTRVVECAYESDFSTNGSYHRLAYVEYPDGKRVYRGYTHTDSGSTFQDTINDAFSRIGQLAFADADSNGEIGDIIAEYDFNGMGRMVRRNH